jgi:hypothetical protein
MVNVLIVFIIAHNQKEREEATPTSPSTTKLIDDFLASSIDVAWSGEHDAQQRGGIIPIVGYGKCINCFHRPQSEGERGSYTPTSPSTTKLKSSAN